MMSARNDDDAILCEIHAKLTATASAAYLALRKAHDMSPTSQDQLITQIEMHGSVVLAMALHHRRSASAPTLSAIAPVAHASEFQVEVFIIGGPSAQPHFFMVKRSDLVFDLCLKIEEIIRYPPRMQRFVDNNRCWMRYDKELADLGIDGTEPIWCLLLL
jgi:hypothetical protein